MREYARARWAPGQVVTVVVAGLFVAAAMLDVGASVVDTMLHLGFGLAGLVLSRTPRMAQAFLIGGGVTYFLLWQFGTLFDPAFVPLHTTNPVVHLALFASMIGLAVLGGEVAESGADDQAERAYRLGEAVPARPRATRSRPPGRADRPERRRAPARPGYGLRARGPGSVPIAA